MAISSLFDPPYVRRYFRPCLISIDDQKLFRDTGRPVFVRDVNVGRGVC